ncbi:hypothetical protein DPMN_102585 [Dreissena polymorpha]|uniref:Uncharacterized protein n=1 Tax=Dreissena polymorpha TaxID=45954 RepID=A0A9D4LJA7_DREPO|nr:hypothetical protein DPMN_102585 [Dreissena polymorpha]
MNSTFFILTLIVSSATGVSQVCYTYSGYQHCEYGCCQSAIFPWLETCCALTVSPTASPASEGLSGGEIALIVIGCFFGAAGIALISTCLCCNFCKCTICSDNCNN